MSQRSHQRWLEITKWLDPLLMKYSRGICNHEPTHLSPEKNFYQFLLDSTIARACIAHQLTDDDGERGYGLTPPMLSWLSKKPLEEVLQEVDTQPSYFKRLLCSDINRPIIHLCISWANTYEKNRFTGMQPKLMAVDCWGKSPQYEAGVKELLSNIDDPRNWSRRKIREFGGELTKEHMRAIELAVAI